MRPFNLSDMIINGSPDISNLVINVIFDISGVSPIIYLENESEGDNLSGVSYAFLVKSPTQTYIHEGDIADPDVTGVWTDYTISDSWPRPFNQIEFSGAPYSFQAIVKDSTGAIYYGDIQEAAICRPSGNLPTSKNTYGVASVLVQVKCEQGRIYFQDTTNATYKGLTGTLGSSVLRVNFPMDDTGTVPDPFIGANFSSALVPVTYSGKGYQFLASSIYQYELSENTFVRIKYLKSDTFGVWCNIDLMPLLCEYEKLINSIENGTCSNAEDANRRLMLINPKFSMVVMGMFQPLIGIDVPALIEEIKLIGGFDCDCCSAASGIIPTNSSVIDGYNFSVVTTGGDVGGSFIPNGNNIQLLLNDKAYIFKICDGSPAETSAFTVVPSLSVDGFTKTYCLNVDVSQFAEDMLTVISTDAALVNLFNSIVLSAGEGNFQLLVDGGCIFSSSQSCDYTFSMNPIPTSTTFAILAYIQTDQQTYNLNHAFNLSSLPALQTALNALGIGTFVVTNAGGGTVLITSSTNPNNILAVGYKNPLLSVATMTKDCVGYTPLSANEVVQNIINYLCDIDDTQVVTSQSYSICYIDPSDETQKTATVAGGLPLNTFIIELLSRGCDTISYIQSLGAVNCVSMKSAFPTLPTAMGASDVFLNTRGGECSQINPLEAFYTMLTYGINNADVKAAFCAMVTACSGGLPCSAYDVFYVTVDESSPSSEIELIVTFDHPDAVSNTIRYARIDNTNTPTYITIPGILPGDSPYTISTSPALANGQYRVYILPVYADGRLCSETFFDTPACTGINSFSASYNGTNIIITYNVESSVPSVRVTIAYPNGGSSSTIHTNGDAISITPPPNVFGTFFATIQPVCNVDTGFYGSPSSQSSFNIVEDETVLIEVLDPTPSSSNRITNVTGISGFVFGSAVNEGETQSGSHNSFTGAISVTIVQPAVSIQVNGIGLYVNGTLVECIEVTGGSLFGQTVNFASRVYAVSDIIRITYDEGVCDSSPTGELVVHNGASTASIADVLPTFSYTITSGSFPIAPSGADVEATHGAVSSSIYVTISGFTIDCNLKLYKNGVQQECVLVNSNGTYTFASVVFLDSDLIDITLFDGVCS